MKNSYTLCITFFFVLVFNIYRYFVIISLEYGDEYEREEITIKEEKKGT